MTSLGQLFILYSHEYELNRLGFGMFTMGTAIFHWLLIAVLYSVNNNKNNLNNMLLIKLFGFRIDVGQE